MSTTLVNQSQNFITPNISKGALKLLDFMRGLQKKNNRRDIWLCKYWLAKNFNRSVRCIEMWINELLGKDIIKKLRAMFQGRWPMFELQLIIDPTGQQKSESSGREKNFLQKNFAKVSQNFRTLNNKGKLKQHTSDEEKINSIDTQNDSNSNGSASRLNADRKDNRSQNNFLCEVGKRMHALSISKHVVVKLISEHGEEQCAKQLQHLQKINLQNQIKNPAAWLVSAIKNNFNYECEKLILKTNCEKNNLGLSAVELTNKKIADEQRETELANKKFNDDLKQKQNELSKEECASLWDKAWQKDFEYKKEPIDKLKNNSFCVALAKNYFMELG